jgi:hypothetical protein
MRRNLGDDGNVQPGYAQCRYGCDSDIGPVVAIWLLNDDYALWRLHPPCGQYGTIEGVFYLDSFN